MTQEVIYVQGIKDSKGPEFEMSVLMKVTYLHALST